MAEQQQAGGLPEGWRETTLGEILILQRGHDLPAQDRKIGLYPIIASTGIVGSHSEAIVKAPGIVIGRSGSIGGGQYITKDFWPLNTTLYVKDFKGNDPRFCYYLLLTIDFKQFNVGGAVPTLNRNHIHPLPVISPPLPEQKAIAAILGALDDKIEANRKMNATLEGIARALFKSWFVDFDPVRAKAEGRPSGLPVDLDALFPASFTDSPLGEIPMGWRVGRLSDVLELAYGKALRSTDRNEGDIPVYGSGGITGYHSEPLVAGPGIIIGRKGTVGSINWESRDFFPIDTVFYVLPKDGIPLAYLYCLVQTLGLSEMNTDAAVPGLNRENAYRLNVIIPPAPLLGKVEGVLNGLQNKSDENVTQNQTLATLRDALLPKLISGHIRVGDAEKIMEKAL